MRQQYNYESVECVLTGSLEDLKEKLFEREEVKNETIATK